MIEVIQMPSESERFGVVLNCVSLRRKGRHQDAVWIGQSEKSSLDLDELDRSNCYHIVNHKADQMVGYARLISVDAASPANTTSATIFSIAQQSNRLPALELQWMSTHWQSVEDFKSSGGRKIVREMLIEAFRIANNNQIRFVFCTCDRNGTVEIKRLGLKYSTLSAPFEIDGRILVIICIAVTNQNFNALNPLKVVGGAQFEDNTPPTSRPRADAAMPDIEKYQALLDLLDDCRPEPPEPPA